MTELLVVFAGAVVVTVALVAMSRQLLTSPALARRNHRGLDVPTAGGMLLVLAVVVVEAVRASLGALEIGTDSGLTTERTLVLFAVLGYGLLGLFDDLVATGDTRGFRGHVMAALRGQLTTGFVKLAGGGMLAVILVATPDFAAGRSVIVDAVIVALAANVANLFDRSPGRLIKVAGLAYVPLAVGLASSATGIAVAPVMGAAAAVLVPDLRERLMLGDTGANVIGAVLGLGVVLGVESDGARLGVLAAVVALNLAAEFVKFSAIIERTRPLRWFDRLGQIRHDRV